MANIVYMGDVQRRPRLLSAWERKRHSSLHWFVECFAETLGVFFYVSESLIGFVRVARLIRESPRFTQARPTFC